MGSIDWEGLARKLGTIKENGSSGWSETGGAEVARKALIEILGPDIIRNAVEFHVSGRMGHEVARSIRWHLHPPAAMDRCHEIFLTSDNEDDRSFAINLLQVVADERVLDWVPQYLADHNEGIQFWGIGIIDQLLWSGFVEPGQCIPILDSALSHPSQKVRERASEVMERLRQDLESPQTADSDEI